MLISTSVFAAPTAKEIADRLNAKYPRPTPLTAKDKVPLDVPGMPSNHYDEQIKPYAGIGEARDPEQLKFAADLEKKARAEKKTYKIVTWTYKGQQMRNVLVKNGQYWQGPNYASGFYIAKDVKSVIINP